MLNRACFKAKLINRNSGKRSETKKEAVLFG